MILVDSSVWIDYLRTGETPECRKLDDLMDSGDDLALTGLILTEVLQGIRSDAICHRTREFLLRFRRLEPEQRDYLLASDLYRHARRQGVTPRSTIDCVLAAVCLNRDGALLHSDRDFDKLSELFGLQVL